MMAEQQTEAFTFVLTDKDEVWLPYVKSLFGIEDNSYSGLAVALASAFYLIKYVADRPEMSAFKISGSKNLVDYKNPQLLEQLKGQERTCTSEIKYFCAASEDFLNLVRSVGTTLGIQEPDAADNLNLTVRAVIDICERLSQNEKFELKKNTYICMKYGENHQLIVPIQPPSESLLSSLRICDRTTHNKHLLNQVICDIDVNRLGNLGAPLTRAAGQETGIVETRAEPLSQADLDTLSARGISAKTAAIFRELADAILKPGTTNLDDAATPYPKLRPF